MATRGLGARLSPSETGLSWNLWAPDASIVQCCGYHLLLLLLLETFEPVLSV